MTSKRRSWRSCGSVAIERRALPAGQGPADPAALAVVGVVAGGLPGVDRGADRPRAVQGPGQAARRDPQPAAPAVRGGGDRRHDGQPGRLRRQAVRGDRARAGPHARGGRAQGPRRRRPGGDHRPARPRDAPAEDDHPVGRRAQAGGRGALQRRGPGQAAVRAVDDRLARRRAQQGGVDQADADRGGLPGHPAVGRQVLHLRSRLRHRRAEEVQGAGRLGAHAHARGLAGSRGAAARVALRRGWPSTTSISPTRSSARSPRRSRSSRRSSRGGARRWTPSR